MSDESEIEVCIGESYKIQTLHQLITSGHRPDNALFDTQPFHPAGILRLEVQLMAFASIQNHRLLTFINGKSNTVFYSCPLLPTFLYQPSYANDLIPSILYQSTYTSHHTPTLLYQPCYTYPLIPALFYANPFILAF